MLKKLWLNKVLVFGFCLIIFGTALLMAKRLFGFYNKLQYNGRVENGANNYNLYNIVEKEDEAPIGNYIGYLKIPKINLEQGLVDKNSHLNSVDLNIQIIQESDMPNVEGGNLILAAHSGSSNVSYFKDLNKITYDDVISVAYNNKSYIYQVNNYYVVEKTGMIDIVRNSFTTTLTLITCIENTNKQLVVICELIKIDNLQ